MAYGPHILPRVFCTSIQHRTGTTIYRVHPCNFFETRSLACGPESSFIGRSPKGKTFFFFYDQVLVFPPFEYMSRMILSRGRLRRFQRHMPRSPTKVEASLFLPPFLSIYYTGGIPGQGYSDLSDPRGRGGRGWN